LWHMKLRDSSQYYHVVLERIPPRSTPAFETDEMQKRVWGRRWGVHNDVGRIELILLHRPGDEIRVITGDKYDPSIDALIDDREQWYFRSDRAPDLAKMQREHDSLAAALRDEGVEVEYVGCSPRNPNGMFVRDTAAIVPGGAVIGRMGPVGAEPGTGRRGEEKFVSQKLMALGMPILHTIHGTGLFEGGSFCLLNQEYAAAGASYRQNEAGIDQLQNVLKHIGIELIEVPLVGHSLHLDGGIVMIDHDKALVDVTRLPYWFLDKLRELRSEAIQIDPRDDHVAINSLAVAPGRVLMTTQTKWTASLLEQRGLEVVDLIEYDECHRHGGSIHCSTLPLIRARD